MKKTRTLHIQRASDRLLNTHVAGMVDESGCVSLHGRIHHKVVVDAEHVAADAPRRVVALADVRQARPDHLQRAEGRSGQTSGQVMSGQVKGQSTNVQKAAGRRRDPGRARIPHPG